MASRYWVGGNATWDATAGTKWATTSGGAGGAAVPTAADDVFLDNGTGTGNVTLSGSPVCRSINCTNYAGTLAHGAGITLTIGDGTAGASNVALLFVSGMTYTGNDTGNFLFASTSSTVQTVDFAGKTMGSVTWDGAGGSWQLTGTMTQRSGAANMRLTNGTLDTNGQTCTWVTFVLGAGTKTLTLGASAITITSGSGTPWNMNTNSAGLTFNANSSTITISASATITAAFGSLTYNNIVLNGSGTKTTSGAFTCANLTFDSLVAGNPLSWIMQANPTITGTLTITGTPSGSTDGHVTVAPGLPAVDNTYRTITAAAVSLTNVVFANIVGAGAATWSGTSLGDAGGNTGITFASPVTRYWVGNGGGWRTLAKWATSSGGAGGASMPLPQDTVVFDANSITSASQTISLDYRYVPTCDFRNVLNSPVLNIGAFNPGICGDLYLKSGMATNNTTAASVTFMGKGNHVIDPDGVTVQFNIQSSTDTGSYTLLNHWAQNVGNTWNHRAGTFDAADFNFTTGSWLSSVAATRVVNMGNGTWTLAAVSGTVWTISGANFTLNPEGSTIVISDAGASGKTFAANSLTYNNLTVTGGGAGTVTFSNTGTYNVFTIGAPKTVIFNASTTQTFTEFRSQSSAGNVITIQSSSTTNHVLSVASGTIACDYLTISDSTAQGGATWYAGANSTDAGGGNSGWIFTDAVMAMPMISGGSMLYGPALGLTIDLPVIGSGAGLNSPTIEPGEVSIAPPAISSTNQLFALALVYVIEMPALASDNDLYLPTVVPGPVTIALPALASPSVLYGPELEAWQPYKVRRGPRGVMVGPRSSRGARRYNGPFI